MLVHKKGNNDQPKQRGLIVFLISIVISLFLLELGTRVYFAVKMHPRILLYGMRRGKVMYRTVNREELYLPGRWDRRVATEDKVKDFRRTETGIYSKYYPYQEMAIPHHSLSHGRKLPVKINNVGFRGEDFTKSKPDNVIRVITLGASSTFGYFDRDDETYPYYLQKYLNERLVEQDPSSPQSFQVLNFGIPHLNSGNIYALFMAEALDFDPDVVTFYEGVNDTRQLTRKLSQRLVLNLAKVSLFLRFVVHTVAEKLESFSAADVQTHSQGKAETFVSNVSRIAEVCNQRGIHFIVVSQQAKSRMFSGKEIDRVSYEQEVNLIRQELTSGKRIRLDAMQLMIHAEINDHLRKWVETNQIPFVDMIKRMSEAKKRHTLASWVHLYPEGNRFLAAELGQEIMAQVYSSKENRNH